MSSCIFYTKTLSVVKYVITETTTFDLLHAAFRINSAVINHLGCSFSRVVEPGASQEHVEFLPGLAPRLLQVQIALNLWTAAGVQKVLQKHTNSIYREQCCRGSECK